MQQFLIVILSLVICASGENERGQIFRREKILHHEKQLENPTGKESNSKLETVEVKSELPFN